jgi:hypothetical protein
MYIRSREKSREIGKRKGIFKRKSEKAANTKKRSRTKQKNRRTLGGLCRFSLPQLNGEKSGSAQA